MFARNHRFKVLKGDHAVEMAESNPDVVIVGGGFAGVTTARELTMRGRIAALLEARDRLGGRTYTVEEDGHPMEFGGTWIHPLQSSVWAEMSATASSLEALPVLEGLRSAIVLRRQDRRAGRRRPGPRAGGARPVLCARRGAFPGAVLGLRGVGAGPRRVRRPLDPPGAQNLQGRAGPSTTGSSPCPA